MNDDRVHPCPGLTERVALVCDSYASAEDAVQEALTRAIEWRSRGGNIRSVPAWITTVAMNVARDARRKTHRETELPGDLEQPEVDRDSILDLREALDRLSHRQQQVVALYYFSGMSVREVAAQLGITDGTVKTQLSRARTSLTEALRVREEPGG